jgi:hypothetical protein
MRFVVLLFGFFGFLLTASLGIFFLAEMIRTILPENQLEQVDFLFSLDSNAAVTGVFLLLAAGFGLLGTLLGFLRCGWQGGVLMIVPIACCAFMNPWSLIFSGLQGVTGLLSCFVSPLPIAAPQAEEEDD